MGSDLVLEVGEVSVAGVGCCGNVEFRVVLRGEEEGEIGGKASDGAAESAMLVLVVFVAFLEKGSVFDFNPPQGLDELLLGKLRDGEGQTTQFLPAGSLGTGGGVSSDDLLLVEQT